MAHCRYELNFRISLHENPDCLVDHDLRYNIMTSETCQNLLISTEHPLREKFGYAVMQHTAHIFGITVISPVTHRISSNTYTYFLLHIDDNCERHPREAYDEGA